MLPQALLADNKVLEDEGEGEDEDGQEERPPEFTKQLNPLMIKPAGNVAELKCQARGPNLNTTWYKVSA